MASDYGTQYPVPELWQQVDGSGGGLALESNQGLEDLQSSASPLRHKANSHKRYEVSMRTKA